VIRPPRTGRGAASGRVGTVGVAARLMAFAILAAMAQDVAAAPGAPGSAASPRIAVAGVVAPGPLRARLEQAVAAGLAASGADVVPAPALSRARGDADLRPCVDGPCWRRLAEVVGAAYLARGSCRLQGSTYLLHLELYDPRTDTVAATRDDTCEICTEADAIETANMAASALKAALGRALAATGGGRPAAAPGEAGPATPLPPSAALAPGRPDAEPLPPATAISTTPQAAAVTSAGAGPDHARRRHPLWRRVLPWLALAGGIASGAAGSYYLSIDGKGSCDAGNDSCFRLYDTKGQGLVWLGIGTALAATGVVLLLLPVPGEVEVAISPTGIGAGLRF
jgi:hypothetical protein